MLAERLYPLSIEPSEEATVRQAAKMINDKIKSYQQLYAAKDKQDFLAMIALTFAVDNNKKDSNYISTSTSDSTPLSTLQDIHTLLDSALEK
jgi:cell division protein ZapA